MSTKSILLANSLPKTSAVRIIVDGLFPASCMPKMVSLGWRRTRDHSSRDAVRKDVARPTDLIVVMESATKIVSAHFHRR